MLDLATDSNGSKAGSPESGRMPPGLLWRIDWHT